jgi:hypothetical protein
MKKLLGILGIILLNGIANAQDRKLELQYEIGELLDNAPKVYTPGNNFTKITGYAFISDCEIELYHYLSLVQPGEDEYSTKRGYYKTTIDFSKLKYIAPMLRTTLYGYNGIRLGTKWAGEGGDYIASQHTQTDDYGNHSMSLLTEIRWMDSVIIPFDNEALIPLLQEYMELCLNP